MQKYTLYEEYITLGQVLKELGLIATGGQAKIYLAENEGQIFFNGEPENRRGKKLRDGDVLSFPQEGLEVQFVQASPEEIAEHEAEKAEEARVKAIVKKMNVENKPVKPAKKQPPRFPGRK